MDLVLTGEGNFDIQSTYGKLPYKIAQLTKKYDIPTLLFAGKASLMKVSGFPQLKVYETKPENMSIENAMQQATENLNMINKHNNTNFIMTYSYGRALQQSSLKFWSKNIKDIQGTQEVFNHRANMCTLAAQGKWTVELEKK